MSDYESSMRTFGDDEPREEPVTLGHEESIRNK